MTPESLLEQFDVIAEAPGGVQRLRQLILQLATRGMLVPQDPREEPAAALLDRIATARRSRTAARHDPQPTLPGASGGDPLPPLPDGWSWTCLAALGEFCGGSTPSKSNARYWGGDVPWVSPKDMKSDRIEGSEDCISETALTENRLRRIPPKSILVVTRSGILRRTLPVAITEIACTVNQDLKALIPYLPGLEAYLRIALKGLEAVLLRDLVKGGTTVQSLVFDSFAVYPIPLPCIAEQHRIVSKVDELMALCTELEAGQQRRVGVRARANRAVLQELTTASNAAAISSAWERLGGQFELLYDEPGTVAELRQVVLQLGVTGKLLSRQESIEDAADPDAADLPAGWHRAPLGTLAEVVGGIQKQPKRRPVAHHFPYLRVANVQRGRLDLRELERFELSRAELDKWRLRDGDLLIVEGNGSESEIGRCAVWRGEVPDCVHQNHLIRVRPSSGLASDFVVHFLNSPEGVAEMKRLAVTTSGLFNLSVGKIVGIQIPVPPLATQHLIVAKVNELMACCDRLEANLNRARDRATRLAAAVVHRLTAA